MKRAILALRNCADFLMVSSGTQQGYATEEGTREVRFEYEREPRPDPLVGYLGGTAVRKTRRLAAVSTRVGSSTVRRYQIRYQDSERNDSVPSPSLVQSIQECTPRGTPQDKPGDPLVCKPATVFNYETPELGLGEASVEVAGYPDGDLRTVLDLNGNGIDDVLVRSTEGWQILRDGQAFVDSGLEGVSGGVFVMDYDQDGRDDLLEVPGPQEAFDVPLRVLRWDEATGRLIRQDLDIVAPVLDEQDTAPSSEALKRTPRGVHVADINGDGLSDILTCNPFTRTPSYLWKVYLARPQRSFAEPVEYEGVLACASTSVALDLEGNGSQELWVSGEGRSGFLGWESEQLVGYWHGKIPEHSVFLDFNGDGLTDIVEFSRPSIRETQGVRIQLFANTGYGMRRGLSPARAKTFELAAGFQELLELRADLLEVDDSQLPLPWDAYLARMVPYDVNHDGRMDLLTWVNRDSQRTDLRPLVLLSTGFGFELVEGDLPGEESQGFRSLHTVFDANGDGIADIGRVVQNAEGDGRSFAIHLAHGPSRNLLTRVTDWTSPVWLDSRDKAI